MFGALSLISPIPGRPQRQTYRRANTSLNLGGENSDLFRSCSSILDKFGAKPSRENLAVINGTARVGRSPNSTSFKDINSNTFKEFLLGRSKERNIFIFTKTLIFHFPFL